MIRRSKKRPRLRGRRMTKKQLAVAVKRWKRNAFKTRYSIEAIYEGYDQDKDDAVIKAAGERYREGSGMSMLTGLRDIRFEFKTERSALAAVHRVKKAVRGMRFMLYSSKRI